MNLRRLADYDVLVLVSLIWFLGKFVRYAFPPLFEPLQAAYGVSNAVIGGAFTGFMVVYALMQFPSGVVADRVGAVRVVVAGATIAGVGALALVVDSPFVVLVAAMLVIGAGTGLHKTVAVRLIARVYPARTGRALGAHDTLGAFGGVAAPTAVVVFLSAPPALAWLLDRLPGADWRGVFLLTGVAALVLAAAFWLRLRGRLSGTDDDGDRVGAESDAPRTREYIALFGDRRFTAFVLVTVGFSFAHNGLVAFLPLYLSRVSGVATTTASLLYSLFFWVTFVQLVTGDLSDRLGRFPVMVATLGLAGVALFGLVFTPGASPVVLAALIAAAGVGGHGFQPVRGAYLLELLPERLAGGGLGVVRTLLMGAGALAPGIVGVIADVSDLGVSFGLLAVSMSVAAIGAAVLWLTEP
ncbi:MFS transporter [Halorubrum luteum]